MFCPKCGSPNDDNAFKCVQCGTVVQAVPPPVVSVKQSNALIIIIVVVVGFFFLISIIGILAAIAVPQFMSYRVKAHDAMAYTTLQNACSTANEILIRNPNEMITLDALIQEGLNISPGIEIKIEDGSAENLTIKAHHQQGRKTYFINIYCNIQELDVSK